MPLTIKKNKTKKNKTKKNKTKKNKKDTILTEKTKPIEDIIYETKDSQTNDRLNSDLMSYFMISYTKNGLKLSKNDFYNYVNELWIKKLNKSSQEMKFLDKLDEFRIIQFKTNIKINELLEDYTYKNKNIVSTEVKKFTDSLYKLNSITSSQNFLNNTVNYIDSLRKDKNNLWKMLAFVNKNEFTNIYGPFCWYYLPDKKNSQKYVNYMEQHQFAVFDISIYENKEYSKKEQDIYNINYKKFFIKYLSDLFKTAFPKDKSLNANDKYDIGGIFFNIMGKKDKNINESPDFYNKVSVKDSLNKYKFNWVEYCKELGYNEKNIPEFFIVSNLNYFKFCTEELLENWNSDKWRSYWIWIFTRTVARFTKDWEYTFYKFHGQKLQGLEESVLRKQTLHLIGSTLTAFAFNPLINNIYIDYAYNSDNIVFTSNLANNLKNIFVNKIKRNTWLEPKTKKYALFKVEKINFEIGSKKIEGDYEKILPLLNYNPYELLDNIFKIAEWRHNLYITGNIDIIKTLITYDFNTYPYKIIDLPSYVVNAEYIQNENNIKISTAYLQNPFINIVEHGLEYNLAYIGFTIAHELCHSLDNSGSKYDVNGNINDWWGKKDKIKFNKIQQEIIKQYEVFSKYDGIVYDASYTIGEDIADISGLHLCEEYLRDYCIQNKYTPLVTYLDFKMFYVYFAYQMRQKVKKESIKYELITNPHPIDKYRTNVTLSRSNFFKTIFDIKRGDKMYYDTKIYSIWD